MVLLLFLPHLLATGMPFLVRHDELLWTLSLYWRHRRWPPLPLMVSVNSIPRRSPHRHPPLRLSPDASYVFSSQPHCQTSMVPCRTPLIFFRRSPSESASASTHHYPVVAYDGSHHPPPHVPPRCRLAHHPRCGVLQE
ncbi:hypothetical protein BD311DRAFT_757877 [Dichomitus squalens]|uniref:Uncharacterized protein n=1 Tax=Dichomitus squalens TaxID=114155 RepID=A0A4Q9MP44_9APHY|nr:hypothetical protein BD311DRAFT_757877 [Dichomitus squalens]